MQVLLQTKYGNLWGYWYEAGRPDAYGNSNEPVISNEFDGPACLVIFG